MDSQCNNRGTIDTPPAVAEADWLATPPTTIRAKNLRVYIVVAS